MTLGIRSKLFLLSLGLVLVSTALTFAVARSGIEKRAVAGVEYDLRIRAALATEQAAELVPTRPSVAEWQQLAKHLEEAARARVTIIGRDGVVLGESSLPAARVATMENHALRPEVRDALSRGVGVRRRHSSTLEHDLLYVALPIRVDNETFGVMRLALHLTTVRETIEDFQHALTIGVLLALGLALLMSSVAAVVASRAARILTDAARRMANGNLAVQVPDLGKDEFGELGHALDQLAHSLSTTLDALRSERDRIHGIVSRMREGVLLLDEDGRVALVNPALREMLLLTDDTVGKRLLEIIRHADLKRLLDQVIELHQEQSQEIDVGGLLPRRLLVRAAPLGGSGGVFAVFFDVTEMRRLESIRRDFVANVSHELRTPVTAIRSAAETVRDAARNDPEALPGFVDIIARNAERLGNLVDDLLELSRIESRELRLVFEPLDIGALVLQVVSLFRERAKRKGLHLEIDVPEGIPPVQADRRAMENVLTNLVDNAVKYSGSGSVVRVRAVEEGTGVRVFVEDTGPGIDAVHLPRIFERFYRVDTGRSRELGGTGLGLSIVKHLVESMGGDVSVESTTGEGTRFHFLLSTKSTPPAARSRPNAAEVVPPTGASSRS